ncbi:MAG: alpha/beta hydrolase family protein [Candidatus Thorarchaeota archaeon]|jgi:pimeloyl-ACP methyl ester carboxylesterase
MSKKKEKKNIGEGRTDNLFKIFKDPETDWAFQRTLQYAYVGAATNGECLYAARRIDYRDGESWIREWSELAKRVEEQAQESMNRGHKISARTGFLRASNYYRTAEYGTPPDHPEFHSLWKKSVDCFQKAGELFDSPIERVEIDFEGKKLPGYLWRPDNSGENRPTLIAAGGNDTSLEELVFLCGFDAVERGYNFFTFEHHGHRGAVHLYEDFVKQGNYETLYGVALDWLSQQPGVDKRIALTGFSFGGYVASRVATYERRIKAVIPSSPLIDLDTMTRAFWLAIPKWIPMRIIGWLFFRALKKSPLRKALKEYSDWTTGVFGQVFTSIEEKLELMHDWKIPISDLEKTACPALGLVSDREGDELLRQARQYIDTISSSKKDLYVLSLEKDGSNDHCQLDNRIRANQIMFDWLDKEFGCSES